MKSTPQLPKATEAEFHEPPSSSTVTEESQLHPPPFSNEETEKWGARIMGPPPAPNFHRDNQQAALWVAVEYQQIFKYPYVAYTAVEKSEEVKPTKIELVTHKLHEWGKKAETIARNIWNHVETGPSVPEAALGKVNLIERALTEDGFESLLKLIFETDPGEKLEKTSNWPCW